jgi:hypothetical protein
VRKKKLEREKPRKEREGGAGAGGRKRKNQFFNFFISSSLRPLEYKSHLEIDSGLNLNPNLGQSLLLNYQKYSRATPIY